MRTPKALTKYLKSKNALIRAFTEEERGQFLSIQRQLRADTKGELTETEYEQLTVMLMFLPRYDGWAKDKNVDLIPVELQNVARLYRDRVIQEMRKFREKGGRGEEFLKKATEIVLAMEREDGGELRFEWKKPKIIDIRPLEAEEK